MCMLPGAVGQRLCILTSGNLAEAVLPAVGDGWPDSRWQPAAALLAQTCQLTVSKSSSLPRDAVWMDLAVLGAPRRSAGPVAATRLGVPPGW
jgi:hypothetical protein